MGWEHLTWYSSFANTFNRDFGLTTDRGETFSLRSYLRDGDDVFLTYATQGRGVDRMRLDLNLLDITAYGRQEEWEDYRRAGPRRRSAGGAAMTSTRVRSARSCGSAARRAPRRPA